MLTLIPRLPRRNRCQGTSPKRRTSPASPCCLQDLFGAELVGVYVGGSYALGDYRRGRSDLDLAAVVRSRLSARLRKPAVERLLPEALGARPGASSWSSTGWRPRARAP